MNDTSLFPESAAMSHIAPDQLYAAVFDRRPLPEEAAQHMAQCAACRRAYGELAALASELAVGRSGAVSPVILERYAALFPHIRQNPALLDTLRRSFTALLTWDSRQQPALQGVRSAVTAAYRLLYTAAGAEIELLVESDGHLFQVQGEIVAQEGAIQGPTLIQWFTPDGDLRYEMEAGEDGQFALAGLERGHYRLVILPASGPGIDIQQLEIA
jgi:hypothetical protein